MSFSVLQCQGTVPPTGYLGRLVAVAATLTWFTDDGAQIDGLVLSGGAHRPGPAGGRPRGAPAAPIRGRGAGTASRYRLDFPGRSSTGQDGRNGVRFPSMSAAETGLIPEGHL